MNTIINDCPFCNRTAEVVWWAEIPPGSARVHCKQCGAFGSAGATREIAITRWNRRVIDEKEEETNGDITDNI